MYFPRKVYAIQHNRTKKIYIGSSKDIKTRYMNHIYQLRKGSHPIEDMQSDYDKYGEDYSLFVLEELTKWNDRRKEYEWMKIYKSYDRQYGYNYKDRAFANSQNSFLDMVIPYTEGTPTKMNDAV